MMNTVFNCELRKGSFIDREIAANEYQQPGIPDDAHSTLVRELKKIDNHTTEERRKEITSFLLDPGSVSKKYRDLVTCDESD